MTIIPKRWRNAWERKADDYLFENYRRKYDLLQNAVRDDSEDSEFLAHLAGNDIFLAIVLVLASNNMHNNKKGLSNETSPLP